MSHFSFLASNGRSHFMLNTQKRESGEKRRKYPRVGWAERSNRKYEEWNRKTPRLSLRIVWETGGWWEKW